jgi:hypothetical protein
MGRPEIIRSTGKKFSGSFFQDAAHGRQGADLKGVSCLLRFAEELSHLAKRQVQQIAEDEDFGVLRL